jgi:hypothetical protein
MIFPLIAFSLELSDYLRTSNIESFNLKHFSESHKITVASFALPLKACFFL